jgi:hypothetical protein
MHHVFKLDEEDFTTIGQIDQSIANWSLELGKIELRLETAKSQLFGNYEARQNLLRRVVKDAGFDLEKVEDIKVGQGGQILVVMTDPQKEPPAGKPSGSTVDGVQTGPSEEGSPPVEPEEQSPPAS